MAGRRLAWQNFLDVTPRTIGRWELGQALPYPYYREQLCTLFGKTARDLGLLPDDVARSLVSLQEEVDAPTPVQEEISSPLLYDPMTPEVPGRARYLLGRDSLFTLLRQRLLDEKSVALTALRGLPGVGKTALATALVMDQQVQAAFRDGILWAGIGPQPNVLSLMVRWGALLGAVPPTEKQVASLEEWSQILRTIIGKRRMLLVLDDVWDAQTALAMQVGGPNCAYLLTTRLPHVAFAFAQEGAITVSELEEEDGVMLLARAVPDLVTQEPEQTRALVRAVGGLPLALMLLGNALAAQVFTGQPRRVQAMLDRLQEAEQRLHVSLSRTQSERPLTLGHESPLSLQAAISISVQRLSENARQALCALAIFPAKPNSFSEEAALAIGQMTLETLDELWDVGLLESNGPGRYRLHQTIADYERVQGLPPEASQRLVRFMRYYLQDHAQDYDALELERSNLFAGLDVAIEVGMQQDLIETMHALVPFLQLHGYYLLAPQYLQQAYEVAVALEDPLSQARMLQHLAHFGEKLGNYQDAERYGMLGLELARQHQLLDVQIALLRELGLIAINWGGNYAQAIMYSEQALELARLAEADTHIRSLLNQLVVIAFRQGNYTRAREMAHEGLELARQKGDAKDLIIFLDHMGQVARFQGDLAQAETFFQDALERALQLGYLEVQLRLFNGLAILVGDRGDDAQSESYLLKTLELGYRIGNRGHICMSLANLGDVELIKGNYAQAESYLLEGVELARHLDSETLPLLLSNLGEAVGYQGEYERANIYFAESVQLARLHNATWYLSAALISWGGVHLHFKHQDAAALVYQEVLDLNATTEADQTMVAWPLYGLARVAALRGEIDQARQLGQKSLATFTAIHHYKVAEVEQWLQSLDKDNEQKSRN